MLLAQSITVESGAALGGIGIIVLTKLGEWWGKWLKDRRERERDKAQTDALLAIAKSNQEIREGQINQFAAISSVVTINNEHHTELIRAIDRTCKIPHK